jgi:hypothetical protein
MASPLVYRQLPSEAGRLMAKVVLYEEYSREEAHAIFSPETSFTLQAGTWGLHGVVPLSDRPGDYVFFVTIGKKQGEHVFDEGITEEGVLSWQSQPRQDLNDKWVKQWIRHDEFINNIYLFFRTNSSRPKYAYLGRLKYLEHDRERERPVYFHWQILDWSLSTERQEYLRLQLQNRVPETPEFPKPAQSAANPIGLIEVPAPTALKVFGKATSQFRGKKNIDYSAKDSNDREMGYRGETVVLAGEKEKLVTVGRADLAEKVMHVSEIEGDGAGYDIKSYTPDGQVRYIEVKTTRGAIRTPFFMSINEIVFSELHSQHYYLYRVFDFQMETGRGRIFKIGGNIRNSLRLEPINFRVKI